MRRLIGKMRMLTVAEWEILITSTIMHPLVALLLRATGYNGTRNILLDLIPGQKRHMCPADTDMDKVYCMARMVAVAARYGFHRADCLTHALVLWWLLARRGIASRIRFGVLRFPAVEFSAHVWVECMGRSLNEADARCRYAVFNN